ncbi:MAG: hypothetical protein Q8K60_01440 [Parachlamydiaceae bacterium]|nr:hypothetical protein [Parachlamydiaceae bacterium]
MMSLNKLSIEEWTQRANVHAALITPITDSFIQRRSLRKKHPVHDFLFTYYNCSPTKLKQWVPSIQEELQFEDHLESNYPWLMGQFFLFNGKNIRINQSFLPTHLFDLIKFILQLCRNILDKPSRFGCFGLHEWAMVYKSSKEEIRHQDNPLRIEPNEIEKFVKSQSLCCSHYDAFRFFTPEAAPLNTIKPSLHSRLHMEQGGCVHANMDLYKWSTKLWPWIGSDFIRKTFFHALEGRELDMRASPYDLKDYGYIPILIETESGRKQYQEEQQLYAGKAQILRNDLLNFCENFLENFNLNKA